MFARYNRRQETPINGIILSSSLSLVFIIFGDFAHLTLFYGVSPRLGFLLASSPARGSYPRTLTDSDWLVLVDRFAHGRGICSSCSDCSTSACASPT